MVVCNSMARNLMGFEPKFKMGKPLIRLESTLDDSIGTYRIINDAELNRVPVFFTSMLRGQGALDRGSMQRLIQHIRDVLGKVN